MVRSGGPASEERAARGAADGWLVAVVVAVTAYLARLVPVLRGGGLVGANSYDGSVYYGAAVGLAQGLLPYRDFLLLHPPGIVIGLLPFAAAGGLLGDPTAMAIATLVWFGLGAVSAVLIAQILRPLGRSAALAGGLWYALFPAAVFAERAPLLEPLATVLTVTAIWLLTRGLRGRPVTGRLVLVAGGLLGLSAGVKIWGVVALITVAIWCAVTGGRRRGLLLLAGGAGGAAAVCLPFFVAAPATMWRMVVLDQLGRPRSTGGFGTRLSDIAGLHGQSLGPAPVLAAGVLVAVACVLAWRTVPGRLAVVLLLANGGVLLAAPSWFAHYAGLTAAPLALAVGAATSTLTRPRAAATVAPTPPAPGRFRWRVAVAVVIVGGGLLLSAASLSTTRFGEPYPAPILAAAAAPLPGCVTTDDVTNLIETDLLRRNIHRGCQFVIDLGGASYDQRPRDLRERADNGPWQAYALNYLRSGSATVVSRFYAGFGFDSHSAAVVRSWKVLARSGRYALRRPEPDSAVGS